LEISKDEIPIETEILMSKQLQASSNSSAIKHHQMANDAGHRLSYYTTAAVAAGVGLLSMAQPAASEVVVTHKTIPILPRSIISADVPLDINGDGITDFSFGFTSFGPYSYKIGNLSFVNKSGNAVIAKGEALKTPLVDALLRGAQVGPANRFNAAPSLLIQQSYDLEHNSVCTDQKSYGHWGGNNPDRFVGVRFQIKGQTHYGWVRLNVQHSTVLKGCREFTATITAYAYETVANQAITIGSSSDSSQSAQVQAVPLVWDQPSLGLLALGADGLALWRREHKTTATDKYRS
jgi:hypothetical protein